MPAYADANSNVAASVAAIVASAVFVALLLLAVRLLGIEAWLYDLLETIREAGFAGRLWLAVLIVIAVVALLPGAPLTLGAGVLYGPVEGTVIVVVATTVGASMAMLLGRHLLSPVVNRAAGKRPKLAAILNLPQRDDWRLVALLRMIPFFPSKLANYVLGLTPLSIRAYVAGSFLGFWPISLFNVWLGSLAGSLVELPSAGKPEGTLGSVLWGGGFLFSAIMLIVLARLAKVRLDAALAKQSATVEPSSTFTSHHSSSD